jgi:hypothetical protein
LIRKSILQPSCSRYRNSQLLVGDSHYHVATEYEYTSVFIHHNKANFKTRQAT